MNDHSSDLSLDHSGTSSEAVEDSLQQTRSLLPAPQLQRATRMPGLAGPFRPSVDPSTPELSDSAVAFPSFRLPAHLPPPGHTASAASPSLHHASAQQLPSPHYNIAFETPDAVAGQLPRGPPRLVRNGESHQHSGGQQASHPANGSSSLSSTAFAQGAARMLPLFRSDTDASSPLFRGTATGMLSSPFGGTSLAPPAPTLYQTPVHGELSPVGFGRPSALYRPREGVHASQQPQIQSRPAPTTGSPVLPAGMAAGRMFETPTMGSAPSPAAAAVPSLAAGDQETPPNMFAVPGPAHLFQQHQQQQAPRHAMPPPAPGRPSRPAAQDTRFERGPGPSHRSNARPSDTFASPPSASTDTSSFQTSPQLASNLDAAALAAERRIREMRAHRAAQDQLVTPPQHTFAHPFQHPPPPQLVRQQAQHQHEYQQQSQYPAGIQYASAHALQPAPAPRRIVSFSAHPTTMVTPVNGHASPFSSRVPQALQRPTGNRMADISLSMSSDGDSLGSVGSLRLPSGGSGSENQSRPQALRSGIDASFASSSSSSTGMDGTVSSTVAGEGAGQTSVSTLLPMPRSVQLRKWDGSTAIVPAWLVSDHPDEEIEDVFEFDNVHRFDVRSIVDPHVQSGATATREEKAEVEGQDVLLGILETQIGLRTDHGWYGYTYKNPRRRRKDRRDKRGGSDDEEDGRQKNSQDVSRSVSMDDDRAGINNQGRTSRKRRRSSSSSSFTQRARTDSQQASSNREKPASEASVDNSASGRVSGSVSDSEQDEDQSDSDSNSDEDGVVLIYDAFGRVRGTAPRMQYDKRGGPHCSLPPPRESAALRTQDALSCTLGALSHRHAKETHLAHQIESLKKSLGALNPTTPTSKSVESQDPVNETKLSSCTTIRPASFYTALRASRVKQKAWTSKHSALALRGLQNAVLGAPVTPVPRIPVSTGLIS
ncbi:hypothetical protein BCV70DRAFT_198607 [Testicularia cyperi]|uniref:Uncharacterized protein n=1 Tax=Testicularia cyperi TaxID=1882483 RepID=A0A317XVK2_9BASI|nr:hypothetical protein BCV70DRAFT_198607 [Testicularia cyperi]